MNVNGTEVNIPGEESHNIGPPWTPAVWTKGPDALVAMAQEDLFVSRADIDKITITSPGDAMSGDTAAPANEQEQRVDPSQPPEGQGRAHQWRETVNAMRATAPLAGTTRPLSYGGDVGTPNPNV